MIQRLLLRGRGRSVFLSYFRGFLKNILKACCLQNGENATVKIEIYFEIRKGLRSSSLYSCMILQFCFLTQTLVNLIYLHAIQRVHSITKKHYIPESTFIYQNARRKHMQGGVCMPCGLLFYECWLIKMYT